MQPRLGALTEVGDFEKPLKRAQMAFVVTCFWVQVSRLGYRAVLKGSVDLGPEQVLNPWILGSPSKELYPIGLQVNG